MRVLSAAAIKALTDPENNGEVWLNLVEIITPYYPPAYFVDNNEDIVSNGKTYKACAFTVQPIPENEDQSAPTASLTIDNIDRKIGRQLYNIPMDVPPNVILMKVLASDPDEIIIGPEYHLLQEVDITAEDVQVTMSLEPAFSEGVPWLVYSPGANRGLFELGQYIAGEEFGGAPTNVPAPPPPPGGGGGG